MKKLLLSLAVAVALVSCGNSAPKPTGDAEKDAKAKVEYEMKVLEGCKTADDLQKAENDTKPMTEEFKKYCNENKEYAEKFATAYAAELEKNKDAVEKKMNELKAK